MSYAQANEGGERPEPNVLVLVLVLFVIGAGRIGYVLDVVLIGLGVGTVIDLAIWPRLLAPEDSLLVTNAMLPMIVALGVMAALTAAYTVVAAFMHRYPRLDIRHHVRRPVHFQLRLAYHAYLIFGGAGICLWTQVYLWRGRWVIWLFGVVLTLAGNIVSQGCRLVIRTDGKRNGPPRQPVPVKPIEITLIVAGILLGIVGLVQKFR